MNLLKVVCQHSGKAVGPSASKNLILRVLLGSLLLWSLAGRASPPPAGVAPVGSPAGGFAIDGDVCANTPITGVGDWLMATNFPGAGAGVLSASGTPLNPIWTFHVVDPYNSD